MKRVLLINRYSIVVILLMALASEGRAFNDPVTGRWITRDPIGYAAGALNLYEYVGSNPLVWVDPFGLYKTDADKLGEELQKLCDGECKSRCKENDPPAPPEPKPPADNKTCDAKSTNESGPTPASQPDCFESCMKSCKEEALALRDLLKKVIECSNNGTQKSNCGVFGRKFEEVFAAKKFKYFRLGAFRPTHIAGKDKRYHVITGITTPSNDKKESGHQIWDIIIDPVDWNTLQENKDYRLNWDHGRLPVKDTKKPGNWYEPYGPPNPPDKNEDPKQWPGRFPGI